MRGVSAPSGAGSDCDEDRSLSKYPSLEKTAHHLRHFRRSFDRRGVRARFDHMQLGTGNFSRISSDSFIGVNVSCRAVTKQRRHGNLRQDILRIVLTRGGHRRDKHPGSIRDSASRYGAKSSRWTSSPFSSKRRAI